MSQLNVHTTNLEIENYLNNYIEFYDLSIINYLSEIFNLHKERIIIKKVWSLNILLDISLNNIELNNIILTNSDYLIFINNSINNIDIDNYECGANSYLILNGPLTIDLSDLQKNETIKFFIFGDSCKDTNDYNETIDIYNTINNINDNIFIIKDNNILSEKDCDYFIKVLDNYIKNNEFHIEKWGNSTNVNCQFIRIDEIIKNEILYKTIDLKIYNIINKVITYLFTTYNIKCQGDSGYCLRKIYGATRKHTDGIIGNTNDKITNICKTKLRNMSIIIALNNDYENGEFYFPKQNFKVKLDKATIIAFPPYWTHPHFVREPSNRTYRYTINTWLYQ